jgi:hypothetical protein
LLDLGKAQCTEQLMVTEIPIFEFFIHEIKVKKRAASSAFSNQSFFCEKIQIFYNAEIYGFRRDRSNPSPETIYKS